MKYVFIINPVAGKLDATSDITPEIRRAAAVCGITGDDLVITKTKRPDHATLLARQAAQDGEPVRIYAVGGDGTFNEVLKGAMPYPNASVGILPYGSGNDFIRNFGTREEFRDLRDQLKGDSISIDMIRTDTGYAAEICSAGLDAKVAYGIPKFRRVPFCHSEMAYKLSIVQCLMGRRSTRLLIDIDGKIIDRECLMVAVCNGSSYGGGFCAAPQSRLDDGVLDVMVVQKMPLARIARVLPLYQAGRHFQDGKIIPSMQDVVEYYPAQKVSIHTADPKNRVVINVDGECEEATGLDAEVVPLAAKIILPQKVFARYQKKVTV